MNKKAQIEMVGAIIVTFVGIIVAFAIFNGGITTNVGGVTSTQTFNTTAGNDGLTANSLVQPLSGKLVTGFVARNNSGFVIESGNYTILNNQIFNNELTATINASNTLCNGCTTAWNVSYTYQPVGFIPDAGGRAMTSLIIIFAALAIAVFALVPVLRSGVMDLLGK